MCAIVVVEDISPQAPQWDRGRVAIVIGDGLDYFQALRQVRALLVWLGAPQHGLGATCWCGEFIEVPKQARVPDQRPANRREEIRHAP
ncbi:hypothetical protein OG762_36460 [Streptomyces sp. NBC_01136]|uniref:hypothetical protein n=1 Tax=unclassified Streptomyces TaxID=2593676 RepID=UPI0032533F5F|nr:hypothetical protein OG762_36460 [Streptomyces sp. NBC_01136]